jgi:hypothetical protein
MAQTRTQVHPMDLPHPLRYKINVLSLHQKVIFFLPQLLDLFPGSHFWVSSFLSQGDSFVPHRTRDLYTIQGDIFCTSPHTQVICDVTNLDV